MTTQGIEMVKTIWTSLAKQIGQLAKQAPDPMVRHLWAGLEESIPQICDAALANGARGSADIAIGTLADLATWLDVRRNEPVVTVTRGLAETMLRDEKGT